MGDWAAMPRPLAKMEMNSSQSTAMAIAWRNFLALSELPPTTGSSQLKPMYMVEVDTEVESVMPCAFISSVTFASPPTFTCTAWSKLSELMPEAS